MIKIDKDKYPPEIRYANAPNSGMLVWKVAENQVLRDYTNNPVPFDDGTYKFPALYKYNEFRDALEACQGPKCCFCEKPVQGGQIEHFRPKKAWQQTQGGNFNRPGYYWLAYRWSNFLISCGECNQPGRKGNLFPVNGARATSHSSLITTENKTLINPAEEDPTQFISFNEDVPVGIDAAGRGQENITIFDLKDRGDLKPIRRDKFDLYESQKMIADLTVPTGKITQEKIDKAKEIIRVAQKKKQPFSGMIRENIKKGFL